MIELVWDVGCPHIDAARGALRQALDLVKQPHRWGEWNVADPMTPLDRRGYGSPTILIDGEDVVHAPPAGASSCRVYRAEDGALIGAPRPEIVAGMLKGEADRSWKGWPRLETERLVIAIPHRDDADDVLDYFVRNRQHLADWDPVRPDVFYTYDFWDKRLAAQRAEFLADQSACFAARLASDPARIVAVANLRNFVRGAFDACHLGYSIDAGFEGRGLMSESVEAVVQFAFAGLGLHRVMANYVPENERSGRLLERLGFEREGYARDYLKIAGEWRDHVLTARVAK